MAWLSGWSYRKKLTIQGSSAGAQTDYQMMLRLIRSNGTDSSPNVFLSNKCQNSFDDIRFTASDGTTLLPYWIEDVDHQLAQNGVSQPTHPVMTGPSAMHYNGKTYVVWQGGPSLDPYIRCYTHSTGQWSSIVKVGTNPLSGNDHGPPAMMIDNNGYIHVAFGCHTSSIEYVRSTNPEDISAWTVRTDLSTNGTYPYWVKDASGNLYVFYRGPASAYKISYRKSTDGGGTWSAETTIIDESGSSYQPYKGNCVYDSTNGRIYIGWSRYDGTKRVNIYLAYLNLSDSKMYSMAGDDLGATIVAAEADTYCRVVNSGSYATNLPVLRLDASGYPHMIYPIQTASGWEHHHVYWTGSAWSSAVKITDAGHQHNHEDFYFSGSNIICYLITAESGVRGGDLEKWVYSSGSWSKEKTVLSRTTVRFDGSNYSLANPQLVHNGLDTLKLVVAEVPNGGDADYGFDDKKVYAFNSDDRFVHSNGVGEAVRTLVKIPSVPASPNTVDIYIYYGNSEATRYSDIQAALIRGDDGTDGNMTTSLSGTATLSRISQGKYKITEDSVDDAFAVGYVLGGWNKFSQVNEVFQFTGSSSAQHLFGLFDAAAVGNIIGTNTAKAGLRRFIIIRYVVEGLYPNQIIMSYWNAAGTQYFWTGSAWTTTTTRIAAPGKLAFRIWDNGTTLYADVLSNGVSIFTSPASITISTVKAFSDGICLAWSEFYTDFYNVTGNIKNFFIKKFVSPEPTWSAFGSEESFGYPSVCVNEAWEDVSEMKICLGQQWKNVSEVKICIGNTWKNLTT